ncbi:MAG: alpha-galactosidase [Lachnospiraceae bacterium]|nr:alpha-galactosidase [Lachnospiraceae bacterium]
MNANIHFNGTISIGGKGWSLSGIFPYIDGEPIHPVKIEVDEEKQEVCYTLKEPGTSKVPNADDAKAQILILSIAPAKNGLRISTRCTLGEAVHDIAPLGRAILSGLSHVYAQGFGMEGPSGYFPITDEARFSHGIVGLNGKETSLICFATDHRHYSTRFFIQESQSIFASQSTLSGGFNLEGTRTGESVLPDLILTEQADLMDGMKQAASQIASEMEARTSTVPAFHWCSWYYLYENMDICYLKKYLKGFQKEKIDFSTIQIDAGYTDHIGDWLLPNDRYPNGLKEAADLIKEVDYRAGIWIAPFVVGDGSLLYREHPDWVVHCPDGTPYVQHKSYTEPKIWGNTDCDYYVLDTTHPDAFAYLKKVFQTYRDYGFSLFKIDFLLWNMLDSSTIRRFDSSKTSVEIIRSVLSMVREIVGNDGYILGSIAPFMPLIGLVDGMRIAGDVGAKWSDTYGPLNLLQALSGGVITTSDPVFEMRPNRKQLLSFIRPEKAVAPEVVGLLEDAEEIVLTHRLEQGNLLFLMNPTEHPIKVCVSLSECFGEQTWYFSRWNPADEVSDFKKTQMVVETLKPHHSMLGFITTKEQKTKITNLWKW